MGRLAAWVRVHALRSDLGRPYWRGPG
jgi:hypothetical protein